MTTERRTAHATMTWIWGISLVMGWTVAFLAAFGIASTLGSAGVWPAGEAVARLDLAALGITMAVLGTVVVLASCRLVFGCWPTVRVWHIAVLLVGVGLAVAVELALHEWARVHIGQYEFDHMGPTAFLASLVLFVAAASFATLIAPVDAEWPPLLAAGLATLLIVVVLVWFAVKNSRTDADSGRGFTNAIGSEVSLSIVDMRSWMFLFMRDMPTRMRA